MRIKVVDMYSDGDLECLCATHDGDNWITFSRWNLLKAAGLPDNATDEQVKSELFGKEFDVRPVVALYIASSPKLAGQNRWTVRETECKLCGNLYCTCGDNYQPQTE